MGLHKYAWKFLIIFLFPILSFGQQEFYNLLPREQQFVVSNLKNPRFVDTMNLYEAFGFVERTGVDRVTDFTRIGTSHLAGGNLYKRDYIISHDTWGDTVCISRGTPDARDAWGGRMDNDSIIIFYGRSNNGTAGDWNIDLYMLRGDLDGNFGSPIAFNFGAYPRLQRCYFFGHIAKGASNGEYYIEFYENNVDTGANRTIIACIKTTDYFRTYSINTVIDATSFASSEGTLAYLGDGKMNLMLRREQSGDLDVFESTNSGVTWSYKNRSNQYWYIAGTDIIPYTFMDTTNTKFTIVTQNRDNDFIQISPNNDTTVFGSSFPEYNGPELFFYNQSEDHASANTSLGYPSIINIVGDSIYLVVWTHETTENRANNMWTRTNLLTDPSGTIPVAPPTITSSFVNTTLFRIDISGYTQSQLNNVRYFMFDMSTDPGFGSFVTAQYRNVSAFSSSVLQNVYMNALWDTFHSLTTGTTYYIRIKACNNNGCSSYTTINVTTL